MWRVRGGGDRTTVLGEKTLKLFYQKVSWEHLCGVGQWNWAVGCWAGTPIPWRLWSWDGPVELLQLNQGSHAFVPSVGRLLVWVVYTQARQLPSAGRGLGSQDSGGSHQQPTHQVSRRMNGLFLKGIWVALHNILSFMRSMFLHISVSHTNFNPVTCTF